MATSELTIKLGVQDQATNELKKLDKQIAKMGKAMTTIGKEMMTAGLAIVGGFGLLVNNYAEAGEAVHNLSIKTGFSAKSLSEWKYVAEQSGTTIDTLELAIKNMALSLTSAATGTGASADAISGLGLNIDDLMAMKPEDQFNTLTTALAGIEDQTDLVSTASTIFGKKVGVDLLPMLADGQGAITLLKDEASALNLVFSDDTAQAATDFNDAKDKLKGSLEGLGNAIALSVMPQISGFITKLTDGLKPILAWINDHPKMFEALLGLGVALVAGGALLMGLGRLIAMFKTVQIVIKSAAMAAGLLQGLLGGWAGIAKLVLGAAAAGGAIWAINEALKPYETAEMPEYTETTPTPEIPYIQGYDTGGIVPGIKGAPVPVMAFGGEQFLGANGKDANGGVNVTINVQGSIMAERDFVQTIRDEFLKIQSRNSSLGFV
jgi:hypothetical protein